MQAEELENLIVWMKETTGACVASWSIGPMELGNVFSGGGGFEHITAGEVADNYSMKKAWKDTKEIQE